MDSLSNNEDDNYKYNFNYRFNLDSLDMVNKQACELDQASQLAIPTENADKGAASGKLPASGGTKQDEDSSIIPRINDFNDFTVDQILDTPFWSNDNLQEAQFATLHHLEESLMQWEGVLQKGLEQYDYNTFGSYSSFYRSYQKSNLPLVDFVFAYQPSINTESMSCVALSLYLLKQIQQADKQHGALFSLVSCEEMIPVVGEDTVYQMNNKDNVKEHVMVCLKFFVVDGSRSGYVDTFKVNCNNNENSRYVLMDPGYHVSRPIVVMTDAAYPHTGWFVASSNAKSTKEYYYQVISDQFVVWKVRESKKTTGELLKEYANIIYVKSEFIKYANVTEKRALIFSMKSYVVRSRKGPIAGFYSWIDDPARMLTIFYEVDGRRVTHKFPIAEIDQPQVRNELINVAAMMDRDGASLEERVEQFLLWLTAYKESINDVDFCPELCEIDKWIDTD